MNSSIFFFQTGRGDEPVKNYIQSLPEKERAAIDGLLIDLRECGRLEYPHGRKISGYKNLYEMRYKRHRIFYFCHASEILLMHAFKKQSQDTPKKEIEVASHRIKLWLDELT